MDTIHAQYNHARWIVICPRCAESGITAAIEAKPGDLFICPEEHPDLLAITYVPNPHRAGAFNAVPDETLREQARQTALRLGSAFEIIFPAEKAEIERVLRARPAAARNWTPGVSASELVQENLERGLA